jgi:hypothetical protein
VIVERRQQVAAVREFNHRVMTEKAHKRHARSAAPKRERLKSQTILGSTGVKDNSPFEKKNENGAFAENFRSA